MAGPRLRRRPLILVLAAVVVTMIVLIAQGAASNRPSAPEAVQAYLDQVRPGVQRSSGDGADFADIRANASKLGRDGADRRLDRLESSVSATLTSVDSLTPPPSLRVPHAYLVAALGVRAKAVKEARGAFDAALTLGPGADQGLQTAVDALGAVGQDTGLGDRALGLFTGALPPNVEVPSTTPWVASAGDWTPAELTVFVTALRSSATPTPVHDLAMVAFQTDPAAVAVQDGAEVIPSVRATTVSMVIENVGNQAEHGVEVDAVLTLANGGSQRLRDFVDLAPGQRRAIGPLVSFHPAAGTSGTLTVTVQPVPNEANLKNNGISTPVVFR